MGEFHWVDTPEAYVPTRVRRTGSPPPPGSLDLESTELPTGPDFTLRGGWGTTGSQVGGETAAGETLVKRW